tara:strand:- start:1888 stop:4323 length:2436 start_codon:yes stop_codon:yes gene_type:complete
MKISYNWIKDYLDIDIPPNKVAQYLTETGLEVEGSEKFDQYKGGLDGLIIGEIISCNNHPNADKLKVTTVDIGDTILNIVCGAPNVSIGQKVVVAPVGSKIYSLDGNSFKIKKVKIRGLVSNGMICSSFEIGIGDDHDGILVLDKSAKKGQNLKNHLNLTTDHIFEIGLTPNRSDAMGHIGVARDLNAKLNFLGFSHKFTKPNISNFKIDSSDSHLNIKIKDDSCKRYTGIIINNIEVKPSPKWISSRLISIGLKPINNIVDITNYLMYESGNPLHAYDYDKIKGKVIEIKKENNSKNFKTLDNKEIALNREDLVISNNDDVMCLAGVIGGLDSGVTKSTKTIFLESAYFDPISVRKSAKKFGLNTGASFRFEREVDIDNIIYNLKRASILIKDIANGKITSNIFDYYPQKFKKNIIEFSYEYCDRIIGNKIDENIINSILNDLEIQIIDNKKNKLQLLVPRYRSDVTRSIDVVEEILRIYGYDNIISSKELVNTLNYNQIRNDHRFKELISEFLSSNGFNEVINNSLINEESQKLFFGSDSFDLISLINPLSKELNVLRKTMLFGGLLNIEYNINRQNKDILLYEFGNIYSKKNESFLESEKLAIWITGRFQQQSWNTNDIFTDLFYLKSIIEKILFKMDLENKYYIEVINSNFSNQSLVYKINNQSVIKLLKLNKDLLKFSGIKQDVYYADIDWKILLDQVLINKTKFKSVSKFPYVTRDLALLVKKDIKFSQIVSISVNFNNKILKKVELFDYYVGKKIDKNKKSYAVRFKFLDKTKTLLDSHVDRLMKGIYKNLNKELGIELRDGEL